MAQETQTSPKITKDYVILGLIIIIFGLIVTLLIINRYRVDEPKDEKRLQDSVNLLLKQLDSSHIRQARLESDYNTLLNRDPQIIYKNHEKTKFIFNTASPDQLDSIIRSVWKTRKKYGSL